MASAHDRPVCLPNRNLVDGRMLDFNCYLAVNKIGQLKIHELVALLFPLFDRYRSNFYRVPDVQSPPKRYLRSHMQPRGKYVATAE